MSFAVSQMVSQSDVLANLAQARRLLEQAAAGGARLAVLPENFAAMGRRDVADIGRAEALGEGPILPWLKQTARDLTLWIVAGTLPLPPKDQPNAKSNACSLLIELSMSRLRERFLEPLYMDHWREPVGQRATLALIAAELDARNPQRRLWAGADLASRLLTMPDVQPWIVPIAETYYLLALEMGAQEERLARADSARAAAEQRARVQLPPDRPTVNQRLNQVAAERDAQKKRADQAETALATKERELRETKAELERIKKIIKP